MGMRITHSVSPKRSHELFPTPGKPEQYAKESIGRIPEMAPPRSLLLDVDGELQEKTWNL
jgi:hypothetical protein